MPRCSPHLPTIAELSGNLERLLKSVGQKAPTVVPVLEINPHHALIARLRDEPDDRLQEWSSVLFDQALLAEGGQLEDPAGFVRRMNALMSRLAGVEATTSAARPAGFPTDCAGRNCRPWRSSRPRPGSAWSRC